MKVSSNVVSLFKKAQDEYQEERREDHLSRQVGICIILGALLFGMVCFDVGLRLGTLLAG